MQYSRSCISRTVAHTMANHQSNSSQKNIKNDNVHKVLAIVFFYTYICIYLYIDVDRAIYLITLECVFDLCFMHLLTESLCCRLDASRSRAVWRAWHTGFLPSGRTQPGTMGSRGWPCVAATCQVCSHGNINKLSLSASFFCLN